MLNSPVLVVLSFWHCYSLFVFNTQRPSNNLFDVCLLSIVFYTRSILFGIQVVFCSPSRREAAAKLRESKKKSIFLIIKFFIFCRWVLLYLFNCIVVKSVIVKKNSQVKFREIIKYFWKVHSPKMYKVFRNNLHLKQSAIWKLCINENY